MANSNFVVHNGLTVGPTTIDAASGNISIPVGKQITIGNIILRDNGLGRLAVRDITDNSDVIIDATLDSGTQTFGNLQFGTNHIESMNASGPISIRPNGDGAVGLFANTIAFGKGATDVNFVTGATLDASYGVNYIAANINLAPGTGKFVKLTNSDASTSTATGALIVSGGVGIAGALWVGANINLPTTASLLVGTPALAHANAPIDVTTNVNNYAQINIQNINSGASVSADFVATAPNGTDSANYIDMGINGNNFSSVSWTISSALDGYAYVNAGNLTLGTDTLGKTVKIHTGGTLAANIVATFNASATASTTSATGALVVTGGIGATGAVYVNSANNTIAIGNGGTAGTGNIGASGAGFNTVFALATSANYADLAENYQADAAYAPGTVVHFGGEFEVTACDEDMCTRVAGVVSTNPAHLMNTGLTGDNVVAVALNGRVPCQVQGTVQKGDLMVSAGNGRARAEANPKVGSVIGKAIENSEGEATIEVVVGVR